MKHDTPNILEPRSINYIFVGYPKETMRYYFYNPLESKVFVARFAKLFESNRISQEVSGSNVELEEILEDTHHSQNTSQLPYG